MPRKQKPDGFVLYGSALRQMLLLPDGAAGRVIQSAAALFLDGTEPEGLDLAETLVFSILRDNVAQALERFQTLCEVNREVAAKRAYGHAASQTVTRRDGSSPGAPTESNREDPNREERNQSDRKADGPPARSRFTPPSLGEVQAYCRERDNGIDPERFLDYYQANGWTQGRGKPIRDWRAAVRTWEGRKDDGFAGNVKTGAKQAAKRFDVQYDV